MRPMKNLVFGMIVCAFVFALMASSAFADTGWGNMKGKPAENPHDGVGPTYCGQPMMLDDTPWADGPPKFGKPEDPVIPTMSPSAWWMQMAVDGEPWNEDPPRKNSPKQ